MKANELRIGNWVKSNKTGNEFKFTSYHFNDLNVVLTSNPPKNLIEPIPLTEEWLVRFGFEDNNINGCHGFWFTDMYINIHFSYNICRLTFEKVNRQLKVKYVHQLQNIYFALTGKELKLK